MKIFIEAKLGVDIKTSYKTLGKLNAVRSIYQKVLVNGK